MAEIAGKRKFNPARFVYLNNKSEKCMDLPARLLWFYTDKKGWRLTLDGTRVIGIKKWIDMEYSSTESPNEMEVVREEIVENYAIGNFSVLNADGYRVTSVGASVKVEDSNFMEELMERGFFLLLDFCGYSPYNISAEDWVALAREKQTPISINFSEPAAIQAPQIQAKSEPLSLASPQPSKPIKTEEKPKQPKEQPKEKKTKKQDEFMTDLFGSDSEPESESIVQQEEEEETPVIQKSEPESLIPSANSRPDGQVPKGISESIVQMKDCSKEQLMNIFRMSMDEDDAQDGNDLNEKFDMLCMKIAGDPWANIENNATSVETIVAELQKRLRNKQKEKRRA